MKKPTLSLVDAQGFDTIVSDLSGHIARIVKKYQLSQKMATRLVYDAWAKVEDERPYRGDPESYIEEHLSAQIARYVELGIHTSLGFTKEEFRVALQPLVRKTVSFFIPPAAHPIIDGELTCFLVVPSEWGCSLRFLLGKLRGESDASPLELRHLLEQVTRGSEVAPGGSAAPKTPYVLVGVKGGRGLKECTRDSADRIRKKFALSYLSPYQLALLFLLRPKFLSLGEQAIALGEKFSDERYLKLTSREAGVVASLSIDPPGASLAGIGKPYYTRMITV